MNSIIRRDTRLRVDGFGLFAGPPETPPPPPPRRRVRPRQVAAGVTRIHKENHRVRRRNARTSSQGGIPSSAGKGRSTDGNESDPTQDQDEEGAPEACDARTQPGSQPPQEQGSPRPAREGGRQDPGKGQGQAAGSEARSDRCQTEAHDADPGADAPGVYHTSTDLPDSADPSGPLGTPRARTPPRGLGD